MLIKYEVDVAGGYGDKVWDDTFIVEAENFEDALIRAKAIRGFRTDWDFTRIEQVE